jgi:hypothetical protein
MSSALLVLVWVVVTLPRLAHPPEVNVDFNGGAELATLFTVNDFASVGWTGSLMQVVDGGVGNSGAVDVDAVNSPVAATYHASPFHFRPGVSLVASVFFKFQDVPRIGGSPRAIELGFVNAPDATLTFNNDDMSVHVSSNNLWASFGAHSIAVGRRLNLVDGRWYRLEGEFENLGSLLWIAATLEDWGPTGEGPRAGLAGILFRDVPDGDVLTDPEMWLAFETSSQGGTDLIDNLAGRGPSAEFPEPASAAMLVAALLGLVAWTATADRGRQPFTAPAVMPFTNHSERKR